MPRALSRLTVTGPMPEMAPTGIVRSRPCTSSWVRVVTPPGLSSSAASLASSRVGPMPIEQERPSSSCREPLDLAGDLLRRAEEPAAAGHVEEGLVDRDRLDQVGEAPVDGEQLLLDRLVGGHVDGQEDALGAAPQGLRHGHRRAHAAGARLIRGGADDAAALGPAADDDRPPPQLGAARLLHRGEEGVHVDQQDGARHGLILLRLGSSVEPQTACGVRRSPLEPIARGSRRSTGGRRRCLAPAVPRRGPPRAPRPVHTPADRAEAGAGCAGGLRARSSPRRA